MSTFSQVFDHRSLYFNIFDRMVDAVYVIDAARKIVYINKAAETLDGYLLKDIKGKTVSELYGLEDVNSPTLKALATERPVIDEEFSYYVNGKEIVQLCNAGPIYEDGCLKGAYSVQRDLTPLKDMVEENIALQKVINRQKEWAPAPAEDPFGRIIGSSAAFTAVVEQARQAAKTDSSVLLIGNTGSGKEVFARAIHDGSDRRQKAFLALNCAAIPETLLEGILFGTVKGVYTGAVEKDGILAQADGGTVFLDEINSMPLSAQAKLLRVLEERTIMKLGSNKEVPVDIRVISSINETPTEALREHHLREDLLYRLSVVPVTIPPLRERKEDIPELTAHFIDKYNARFGKNVCGVDAAVMARFTEFSWPGNVRQLKTCVESAMNFAADDDYIRTADLPVYLLEDDEAAENHFHRYLRRTPSATAVDDGGGEGEDLFRAIAAAERQKLEAALRRAGGNVAKAGRALGISRQLMTYRLKKYGIK